MSYSRKVRILKIVRFVLGEDKSDVIIQLFNAANYIDGASPAIATITVKNNITFQ